ncbi:MULTISPECIES: EutP/PduV family microcompartment system protein [unclassified Luteococcus]|uniref:EutP/PduV family microcompartment system protein n=1 Tax=unclassified Luteococcus TaxID=2639923 RepID=UPI00313DEDEB
MKRLLLVGSVGAGKTTLAHRLQADGRPADKTQATEMIGDVIDTPGEYLDHGRLNHALLLASYDADVVALLQGAGDGATRIPPGFASYFTCPVIGVVTKVDIAAPSAVHDAREALRAAGSRTVVEVSALTGDGLADLLAAVEGSGPDV